MFVLNAYFCRELKFVAILRSNSDFYSEIQALTQILFKISEEKFGGCMYRLTVQWVGGVGAFYFGSVLFV